MVNKLKYLFGALLFSTLCHNVASAPSLESTPPNTIEKTIEYNEKEIQNTETAISRGDLSVNIFLDEYKVGDLFDYSGKIQNTRDSKITIDGQIKGLEWKLLKENQLFDTREFKENFSITFKKHGFIEFDYVNDKLRIKTSSTIIKYNGINREIPFIPLVPPFSVSIDIGIPLYEFTEAGTYISQLHSIYLLDGKKYETIFESQEFEVKDK